jgi:hypothetical protein
MVEALTLLDRRFADDGLRLEGAVVLNAQELQQVRLLVLQLLSPHPLPTGGVHLPQLVGQDDAVPAQLSPSSGMGQRNALFAEPLHAPAHLLAVPAALQVQAREGLLEGEQLHLHRPLALPRLRRPHLRPPRQSLAPAPLPQHLLVLLQLPLETQVGQHLRTRLPHCRDGLAEGQPQFAHEVGEDEGGALPRGWLTLEMPAEQWTSTLPLLICFSMSW